jgi:hypothetical protein
MPRCGLIDLDEDRKWRIHVNLLINLCFVKDMEYLDDISGQQLKKKKSFLSNSYCKN